MTIREQLEKEIDKMEIEEIKDKTTKDGILRLLRESGVPEEKLNEVYNALFEKVKKERIFPKKEIEEWCKQIKKRKKFLNDFEKEVEEALRTGKVKYTIEELKLSQKG